MRRPFTERTWRGVELVLHALLFAWFTAADGWRAVPWLAAALAAGSVVVASGPPPRPSRIGAGAVLGWAGLLLWALTGAHVTELTRAIGALTGSGSVPGTGLAAAAALGLTFVLAWSAATVALWLAQRVRRSRLAAWWTSPAPPEPPPGTPPGRITLRPR